MNSGLVFFLIVLDDVWNESYDNWDELTSSFLAMALGSNAILATRKNLSLFAQYTLGVDNIDSYPTLRPHSEGFVKKCDG